jgi:nitrogen fixation protein NifB
MIFPQEFFGTYRKINEHPCYSEKAQHIFGRIHLPVAPKCNIQCNYCVRKFDCVNESKPGITSQILTPEEALERTKEVINRHPFIKVVAVAGPGEPLANEETFETFSLIRDAFPWISLCTSTNGLLLLKEVERLKALGLSHLTITINAVDPEIAEKIYSFIEFNDRRYEGKEAAVMLLDNQWKGLKKAVELGMLVKVNTVYIPGINEEELPKIAELAAQEGAFAQNIMPLIPQYKFSQLLPPTPEERRKMQERCAKFERQMIHCRQCRADACGLLNKDMK